MIRTPWLTLLGMGAALALFSAVPAQAAFTDNGNGTISDTVTGLMWDKCSIGLSGNTCATGSATLHTWQQALAAAVTANGATYKTYSDWRLPNKNELESLVDITLFAPSINTTSFPATQSGSYWTSTNYYSSPSYAWLIDFNNGYASSFSKSGSGTYYVRLVRAGQTNDTYDLLGTGPTQYSFTAQTGVALSTVATSNSITVSGATGSPSISISGGTYSINGGAYTAASGTVSNGNTVTVRQTSSSSYATKTTATLNIGGTVGTFDVTTLTQDTLPTPFSFTAQSGVALSAVATSNSITVSGITTTTTIAVSGGTYSKNGGAYTSTAGTVSNGDTVTVRQTASSSYNTKTTVTLLIGGVPGLFDVTTVALDTIPSSFAFTDQTGVALSATATSNTVTVAGLTTSTSISISGGTYSKNGGAYTSTAGTVINGDTITVRQTASTSYNTMTSATLNIGTLLRAFNVTTTALSFTAQTGAALSSTATSNSITYTGTTPASISISGGTYSKNGGAYTAIAGTVSAGNTVTVRQTASASYGTKTTATLTIGTATAAFDVTTLASVSVSNLAVAKLTTKTVVTASDNGVVDIPSGTGSTGSTISLPLPGAGTAQPVHFSLNGIAMRITPTASSTVLTVITATVSGASTQLLSLTSGAVRVTSNDSGTPLLAVGGGAGSNVVTVTPSGGGVQFDASINSGNTIVAVSTGVITLATNSFASAGNGFAEVKDGAIYSGEVATISNSGKLDSVRLGSLGGASALIGDPISVPAATGLKVGVPVPSLKGKVVRISGTQDFSEVLAAVMGGGYTAKAQSSQGVLRLDFSGGITNLIPTGEIRIDTSRADGVSHTAEGKMEVARNGVIASFMPSVADPAQLAGQVVALDKNAAVTLGDFGVIQARINGVTYVVQPGWVATRTGAASSGFAVDSEGRVALQDSAGNLQTLYPAFGDITKLGSTFKAELAEGYAVKNDGTISVKLGGKNYTLLPDYTLIPIPADQQGKNWWIGADGRIYVKNSEDTAQGFAIK